METKHCTHCKETKPVSEYYFNRSRNNYESLCKQCRIDKTLVRTIINKGIVAKAKYNPCYSCGKLLHPEHIDLHHLDPSKKDLNVSNAVFNRSPEGLQKEIDKCVPVCRPCHREIHRGNRRSG